VLLHSAAAVSFAAGDYGTTTSPRATTVDDSGGAQALKRRWHGRGDKGYGDDLFGGEGVVGTPHGRTTHGGGMMMMEQCGISLDKLMETGRPYIGI
jgi:hypothetical protein